MVRMALPLSLVCPARDASRDEPAAIVEKPRIGCGAPATSPVDRPRPAVGRRTRKGRRLDSDAPGPVTHARTGSVDGQVKRVVVRLLTDHRDRVGATAAPRRRAYTITMVGEKADGQTTQ